MAELTASDWAGMRLRDGLVAIELDAPRAATGLIYHPEAAREMTSTGRVLTLSCGGGLSGIRPGDRVVFLREHGGEFETGAGENVVLVRQEDVEAVIE